MLKKIFEIKQIDISESQKGSINTLRMLGVFAVVTAIMVMVETCIYHLEWYTFGSISASATYYGTAYLLPFLMGGMAVYFWGYFAYGEWKERTVTKTLAVLAFFVAMFQCETDFNRCKEQVGLLGVSPCVSNIIHTTSAILLFALLFVWIFFFFTKSDKKKEERTKEKNMRNSIFIGSAIIVALLAVVGTITAFNKQLPISHPIIFYWETLALIVAGFAIMVKGGLLLKDKQF